MRVCHRDKKETNFELKYIEIERDRNRVIDKDRESDRYINREI